MEERSTIPARGSCSPAAVGIDPAAIPPDAKARARDVPTFEEAITPQRSGVEARDPFYYARQITSSERFRQKHFDYWTWAMIVVAGVVAGGAAVMMAAGA